MNDTKSTGRPKQRIPILPQLTMTLGLLTVLAEAGVRVLTGRLNVGPAGRFFLLVRPQLVQYAVARAWVVAHRELALCIGMACAVFSILAVRWCLLFWHNQVVARLTGSRFEESTERFPLVSVDLIAEIARRPMDKKSPRPRRAKFVGLTPSRGRFRRWKWKPVYISPRQQTMHRHVIGKTGSGKTASILWPSVLQDAIDGKGILVMDAKGSDENIRVVKAGTTTASPSFLTPVE